MIVIIRTEDDEFEKNCIVELASCDFLGNEKDATLEIIMQGDYHHMLKHNYLVKSKNTTSQSTFAYLSGRCKKVINSYFFSRQVELSRIH